MFLLEKLDLRNHPQLGTVELSFLNDSENKGIHESLYSTIIIGNNGTGKSFLLKTIADIFTEFKQYSITNKREKYFPFDFDLRFSLDKNTYEIISLFTTVLKRSKSKTRYGYTKNRPIETDKKDKEGFNVNKKYLISLQEIEFPQKTLVNSVMLNDRFTFSKSNKDDFYQYLGIRRTKSVSSTKTFVRNSVNYLFESLLETEFSDRLSDVLNFMDFNEFCKARYNTRYHKEFFNKELTVEKLNDFYLNWSDTTNRTTAPWGDWYFNKLKKENPKRIDEIVNYIKHISSDDIRIKHKDNSKSKYLELNFFDEELSYEEFELVNDLDTLSLINLDGLYLQKKDSNMAIQQTSSGEYHLILSLLGLYSRISNNSLVLIDEPEISLHPKWQMRYINFIKKMFHQYSDCHFILSSHSHFIVSDLEPQTSSVVAIKRNIDNDITTKLLDYSTYGWSAEQILLEVFETGTTRNYYLTEKLSEVFELIAVEPNKRNLIKIKSIVNDIREKDLTGISDSDPLKDIINKLLDSF